MSDRRYRSASRPLVVTCRCGHERTLNVADTTQRLRDRLTRHYRYQRLCADCEAKADA